MSAKSRNSFILNNTPNYSYSKKIEEINEKLKTKLKSFYLDQVIGKKRKYL